MGTVFNHNRTYGVELEVNTSYGANTLADAINAEFTARGISAQCQVQSYNHRASSSWKIVSDATVRGWEVVSPILKGLEGKEEIDAVCAALRSLNVTTGVQTGMHVHHDARGLTAKQIGGTFGAYAAFQTLLNYGVSRSRRGREQGGYNTIANWNRITSNGSDNYNRNYTYGITADTTFRGPRGDNASAFISSINRKIGMARECSISIGSSLSRHGTIEFRQHQGTTNATKVWTWVLITQSIIERQVQNRVSFPKPVYVEIANGKSVAKGDFIRFKRFIAISPRYNGGDTATTEPYVWAFKQLYKNIKKFARQDGITDTKDICKNQSNHNYVRP